MRTRIGLSLAAIVMAAVGEVDAQSADGRLPLERLFEVEAPVDRWVDAIPLGNGQAGALVWGSGDELRLTLDRADYWHVERNPMLDDPDATWANLASFTNDMPKLLAKYVIRKDPCKLPGVRLTARFADGVTCRRFVLNARDGSAEITVSTHGGDRTLRAWFEDDSPYLSLSLPADIRFASMSFSTNAAFARLDGYPEPTADISEKGAFYRRGNRAGVTGPRVRDFVAGVRFVPDSARPASAFWKRFWTVSDVSVPDAQIQRFYDFAMYCYGAASRPPHAPIALQAVWTADNGDFPPWHGDYHMDLNVQESYWAAPVAGHLDALDAYAFLMTDLLPAFRDYGRSFFGLRDGAAAVPGHMAYDGTFIAGGPLWALPLSHGLWGFAEVFNAWAYCPTKERLERIWPLARALAEGVDQVLLAPDADGVRRYAVSGSPEISTECEIGESDVRSFLRPNTSYDRAVTKGFLKQAAQLAEARGCTAEARRYRALADALGPAVVDGKGRYLIAPGMPLAKSHLHLSHLHDVFPFKDVDPEADARASVEHYLSLGKLNWAGHTLPEAACKCACVGLGDAALECLSEFATHFTARNGFHLNYWYRDAVKPDREPNDVFTLEANLAFARGVQEMLLGGEDGRIRLFPALPSAWKGKRTSFRDWRVPGGHRVTAVREPDGRIHGQVVGFSDASVELVFPDGTCRELRLKAGEPVDFATRPVPRPEMLARFDAEFETDAILHFGLATVANREWGYGDEDPALFNPTNLDADAIVAVCRSAGLQGLTLVAKHHDGFCLWPTKTTGHNITKSPWKGGRGDVVRLFADACRRGGIRFGVYVSPWDRNNADYGTERYRRIYHEQWREVASGAYGPLYQGWFDGANGGDGYYGGAREKRRIPGASYYDFPDLTRRLKEWNPGFVCTGGGEGVSDFRYPGQEDGFCDPDARCGYPSEAEAKRLGRVALYKGVADGRYFVQPICDFPQNPGWFYHPEHAGVSRSAEFLMKIYLNSVGHGGLMEIGLAPRADGSMDPANVRELQRFGAIRKAFFSSCSARGTFRSGSGTLEVPGPFDVVLLREDLRGGERIDGWELWLDGAGGASELLAKGESIGVKRIRILDRRIPGGRIRLVTTKSTGTPLDVTCAAYDVDPDLIRRVTQATYVPPNGIDLVSHDPMGKVVFSIVVSERAGAVERQAAELLRDQLKTISGTELPIVTDAEKPAGPCVFLGRTRFTESLAPGTDYGKLGPDGCRLKVSNGHLVIESSASGSSGSGVLNGVYRILDRTVGFDRRKNAFTSVVASGSFVVPGDLDEMWTPTGVIRRRNER